MKYKSSSRTLVSAKFILITLQLIITILAMTVRHENIAVGMRALFSVDDSEYAAAEQYVLAFGVLSILFQFMEIAVNMMALNIHFVKINSILCTYHFLGFIAYLFYLFDRWHYKIMMYMWVVFCILPLLLEILTAVNGFYYYGIYDSIINARLRTQYNLEQKKRKELEEKQKGPEPAEEELQRLQGEEHKESQ